LTDCNDAVFHSKSTHFAFHNVDRPMNNQMHRDARSNRKDDRTIRELQQENAALRQSKATMKHHYDEEISRLNHHIQQLKNIIGNVYPYLSRSSNFIQGKLMYLKICFAPVDSTTGLAGNPLSFDVVFNHWQLNPLNIDRHLRSTTQNQNRMVGILGTMLRYLFFTRPRPPYNKDDNPVPSPSIGGLQTAYLKDRSKLLIMVYAMATGYLQLPSRAEYVVKQRNHRMALIKAGMSADLMYQCIRPNCLNNVSSPLQLVMQGQINAQRSLPYRFMAFIVAIGITLKKRRIKQQQNIVDAAGCYQYLPWSLLDWGVIVQIIADNCIYKRKSPNAKGQFIENKTSDCRRTFSPSTLRAMGFYTHIEKEGMPEPVTMEDFTAAFK
jgi:hypothetical protein